MLSSAEGRSQALPLEVVGLGYVNLLHIAVTLAAIPDAGQAAAAAEADETGTNRSGEQGTSTGMHDSGEAAAELEQAERVLQQARAESESLEDSFFPDGSFHVTVLIEEPRRTFTLSYSTLLCGTSVARCS